jgi:hypothetical protein
LPAFCRVARVELPPFFAALVNLLLLLLFLIADEVDPEKRQKSWF